MSARPKFVAPDLAGLSRQHRELVAGGAILATLKQLSPAARRRVLKGVEQVLRFLGKSGRPGVAGSVGGAH